MNSEVNKKWAEFMVSKGYDQLYGIWLDPRYWWCIPQVPILFKIFIDLDNRAESTLRKFADETNVEETACVPDDCSAMQRDFNKLKKWADRSIMKFNKIKCQVLPLWKNNSMHKYTLGADWLKDSFAKKDQSEGPSDRKFERKSEMCHYVRQQPLGLL